MRAAAPSWAPRTVAPAHRIPTCIGMITIVTILLAVAMLGTLGVLFAGMVGMVRGDADGVRSNALMRWRVTLQGAALALFALLLLLMRS